MALDSEARAVEHRVNVIRSALECTGVKPVVTEGTQKRTGNRRLAAA